MYQIVPLEAAHAAATAEIHLRALRGQFLPDLGLSILRLLHRTILETGAGFGFVAVRGGRPVGFVIATLETGRLFRRVLAATWMRLLILLAGRLLTRPTLILRVVETALYPARAQAGAPLPELVVIAVEETERRTGIGRLLVSALEDRLAALGVRRYEVSVDTATPGAMEFYAALGFVEARRFRMYGAEWTALEKEVD